jgi:hypothetical protein
MSDPPKRKFQSNHLNEGASIMKITAVGIDLAKNIVAVPGVNGVVQKALLLGHTGERNHPAL